MAYAQINVKTMGGLLMTYDRLTSFEYRDV